MTWRLIAFAALTPAVLAGCGCAGWQKARTLDQELAAQNRLQVERSMAKAAAQRGAKLLSVQIEALPAACGAENAPVIARRGAPPGPCARMEVLSLQLRRVWKSDGKPRLAVLVPPHAQRVHLARRGTQLLLLAAKMSWHSVGKGSRCECDGGPQIRLEQELAFLVDDMPTVTLEDVEVPVVQSFIDWECKSIAV